MSIKSLGKLNEYEQSLIAAALPELATNIEKVSIDFQNTFLSRLTNICLCTGRLLHLGFQALR